jgi:hypothetical protein
VEDGLARAGYQASADPNAPNSIAVSINQFWAWMDPGFVSLTFHTKISCTVSVNSGSGSDRVANVRGYGQNPGQVARDANWQDAFTPAFEDFVTNLSREVEKIGLRPDSQPASQKAAAPAPDVYEELKHLDELRKSGIITEEEFEAQKKKILQRN